ncbi:uncharacterized protein EI90DRAFT_3035260 [Cantharellus anzutake]|uniref:uncharacterized protein n=1 Tax=Cantharellus anzutake TaxID=1750568 RepID=UPI0019051174|nr:uncharacterized protein EI90DRAFT_3035260 [Cantharellus anzutake]KAF8340347.1 hypothetical protein EI90DRAFT_3035260 [Cantharellus anzutake]
MAQGKTRLAHKKSSGGRSDNGKYAKKGRRVVAPKAAAAVKQHALQKKLTAKIGSSIEKQMVAAASSGKLTIMKNVLDQPSTSKTSSKDSVKRK